MHCTFLIATSLANFEAMFAPTQTFVLEKLSFWILISTVFMWTKILFTGKKSLRSFSSWVIWVKITCWKTFSSYSVFYLVITEIKRQLVFIQYRCEWKYYKLLCHISFVMDNIVMPKRRYEKRKKQLYTSIRWIFRIYFFSIFFVFRYFDINA